MRRMMMVAVLATASLTGCEPLEPPFQDVGEDASSPEQAILDCFDSPELVDFHMTPPHATAAQYVKVDNNCTFSIDIENVQIEDEGGDAVNTNFRIATEIDGVTLAPNGFLNFMIEFIPPLATNSTKVTGRLKMDLVAHTAGVSDETVEIYLTALTKPAPTPTARVSMEAHYVNGTIVDLINDPRPIPLGATVWMDATASDDGLGNGLENLKLNWSVYDQTYSDNPLLPVITPGDDGTATAKAVACGVFTFSAQVINPYAAVHSQFIPVTFLCPEDYE